MPEVHYETVYFSGRVQGVGFRYAALEAAREFDVAGFVQNLPDGRVALEVEGRPEVVAEYIALIQSRMQDYVRKAERSSRIRESHFSGFIIKS